MKFLLLASLALFALGAWGEKVRYDNYKVYRFIPQNEEERQVLLELQNSNLGVMFWKGVRGLGQPVDVMIPPHLQGDLVSSLSKRKDMSVSVFVEDVQKLIDEEAKTILPRGARLDWNNYAVLEDIYAFLDEQAAMHSDIAQTISIGNSFEGRPLKVMKISKSGETKPAIWYDASKLS